MAAPTSRRRPPQISLRGLLCAVAAVAATLAIGKAYGAMFGLAVGCGAIAAGLWSVALRLQPAVRHAGSHKRTTELREARRLFALSCVYCAANGLALLWPLRDGVFWHMLFSFPAPFAAFFFGGLFGLCREARVWAIFAFWATLAAAALGSFLVLAESIASC